MGRVSGLSIEELEWQECSVGVFFLTDVLFVDVAVHSRILACIKLGLNCHESAGIKSVENWPDHVVGEQELLLFLSCHEITGLEEMCVH